MKQQEVRRPHRNLHKKQVCHSQQIKVQIKKNCHYKNKNPTNINAESQKKCNGIQERIDSKERIILEMQTILNKQRTQQTQQKHFMRNRRRKRKERFF